VQTGYLTDCMEQTHFWEADTHPSYPLNKFPALLRHQFHHSVHNIPPPAPVLNQIIRVTSSTIPDTSILILSSIYMCLPNGLFPSLFQQQVCTLFPTHATCPAPPIRLDVPTLIMFAVDCIHTAPRYSVFSTLTITFCLPSQLTLS